MAHKYQQEITCPHCNHEHSDSWEFGTDNGTRECYNCGVEFNVDVNIEVTYSTSKISCERMKAEHDYKMVDLHLRDRQFKGKVWLDLPETEWRYFKIMKCQKCGDEDYVLISKEQYYELKEKLKNGKAQS
jgi:transcription elongation factor Elf1